MVFGRKLMKISSTFVKDLRFTKSGIQKIIKTISIRF